MKLPIKLEGILYSKSSNNFKFLLLKRSLEDGGFWQPLTGTLEDGESLQSCLLRELDEETGIKEPVEISNLLWKFEWKNKKSETITEFVYAIRLKENQLIRLSNEHSEYQWCNFDQALNFIEKTNNKMAFIKFKDHLM